MKENDLLAFIAAYTPPHPGVPLNVGDDMAVVSAAGSSLLKIDQCLDQVHFDLRHHTAAQAGRKAVNRCLSDCAAMACLPAAILLSVALPRSADDAFAQQLFLACRDAAALFDCPLVGGDTSVWSDDSGKLAITIAALGKPAPGVVPVTRAGARPGDALFVTGQLGGSILGRHMTFTPRIHLAIELAKLVSLHAMMDLSDGLAQDMPRLCKASGVGAIVAPSHLPLHPDAETLSLKDHLPAALHALADGEDYELVFAIAEADIPKLFPNPNQSSVLGSPHSSIPLTRIGTITAERTLHLMDADDQLHPWPQLGWEHRS